MSIGFIGLGSMGEPMAANIARSLTTADGPLTVHDLRAEPLARLEALGARRAATPRELAAASQLVQVMVVDDAQVRAVVTGPDGVLAGAGPDTTLIIHSTIHPDTCRELANLAQARGVELLDAPVSGAAFRARDAELSMLVGGSATHLARWRPLLAHTANRIFHIGPVGAGLVAKLANNLIAIANGRVLEEGLALARAAGIDDEQMLEVLNASSGQSFATQTRAAMRAEARAHPGGRDGLRAILHKDISLALALVRDHAVRAPLAERLGELIGVDPP